MAVLAAQGTLHCSTVLRRLLNNLSWGGTTDGENILFLVYSLASSWRFREGLYIVLASVLAGSSPPKMYLVYLTILLCACTSVTGTTPQGMPTLLRSFNERTFYSNSFP